MYIAGGSQLRKIGAGQTVAETLAGDIHYSTYAGNRVNSIVQALCRAGTSVKIAVRNLLRRKGAFNRTFAIVTIAGAVVFVSLLGTICVGSSIQSYAHSSIDENTIAVGHTDALKFVGRLYGQFSDPTQRVNATDVNFSDPRYFFPESKFLAFTTIDGVTSVDPRVCLLEDFRVWKGYIIEGGVYYAVGENRSATAVIMGTNSSLANRNFFQTGTFVTADDDENVTIGDGIGFQLVADYTVQRLEIHSEALTMRGIVMDTLYNGQSIYMGMQGVWRLWPALANKYNLLLIQVAPEKYEQSLASIQSLAKGELGSSFTALDLRPIIQQNNAALLSTHGYFMALSVIAVVITAFALAEFQRGASTTKTRDLRTMRLLGARRGFLAKHLFWENFLLTVPATGLALGVSMLLVEFFFIADIKLLPPLWVPLSFCAGLLGVLAVVDLFMAARLSRHIRGMPADLIA